MIKKMSITRDIISSSKEQEAMQATIDGLNNNKISNNMNNHGPLASAKSCRSRSRRLRACLLFCSAVFSLALLHLGWFTDMVNDIVASELRLRNGSLSFEWWQRPIVKAVYKVHVFNYTNVKEFEAGRAKKLRVQETGPYIYRETLTRIVTELDEEAGTVTYREKRDFVQEGGRPDNDRVMVPNIVLFSAMARLDSGLFDEAQTSFLLNQEQFKSLSVSEYLWGYNDVLFSVAKMLGVDMTQDKPGILALKSNLSKDSLTISSGMNGTQSLGYAFRINGKEQLNVWNDTTCNKVEGSDGTMFPPHLMRDHTKLLQVYSKEMCRTIPLEYSGDSIANEIPTYRYKIPENVFATSMESPCYCQKYPEHYEKLRPECPLKGLFDNSKCLKAPMLSSFPHFYQGDKLLLNYVEGLRPQKELHETYLDLHPRLGVPVAGWSRIQINLEVRKTKALADKLADKVAEGFKKTGLGVILNGFKTFQDIFLEPPRKLVDDGMILPVLWVEVGIDNMPDEVMEKLRSAHIVGSMVEISLRWGSLLGLVMSALGLLSLVLLGRRRKHRDHHIGLHRNVSGQDPLIEAIA